MKPLIYALNRAKKVYKAEGKKKLNEFITSGQLIVRAKNLVVSSSSKCHRFSLTQLPFLTKEVAHNIPLNDARLELRRQYHPDDKAAYDLAYPLKLNVTQPDNVLVYRGAHQILVWRDLCVENEFDDAIVQVAPDVEYDEAEDYIAELDFSPNYEELKLLRIQLLPNQHMNYSRYRSSDMATIVLARGLECHASQVEELLPHKEEYRSSSPSHRPSALNMTELFTFLDSAFSSDPRRLESRGEVAKEIRNFEAFNPTLNGGVSDSTVDNYRRLYLVHAAKGV